MLHLIMGGAGTGKSTCISEQIALDIAKGTQAYLIIPEQQANLSERTMLPRLPESAGLTFTIAGFSKLYDRVAARHGGITTRPPERPMRLLLLWECLRCLAPLMEEYRLPPGTAPDGSLTALLLQTIEELQSSSVSPATLDDASLKLPDDTPLKKKLRDICLLYATYEARIASLTESDGSDTVAQLATLLGKHAFFADANIYIDSFTDFTAEEYDVLDEMLQQAASVTVALSCDSLHTNNPAFACAADTAQRLLRLANQRGVTTKMTRLTENRRAHTPELALLSEQLWDFSHRAEQACLPPPDQKGSITLLQCTDIYAESEAIALHILHHLHEDGIPYGQMAIIVRDTETYRGVLDAALERYGIPFYFSDKCALSEKPLCRFLLSALRAVTFRFASQDILTMLKTGLIDLPDADLDFFEQYVDTWNITGNDFVVERWSRNPDGYTDRLTPRGNQILDAANRVREFMITPLLQLYTALRATPALPDCCRALYHYMEQMGLAARCACMAENELSQGDVKQAGETLRVYDAVVDTLTDLALALPDVTMTPEEFCAALTLLFSQSELASVPSTHDCVTVGKADTLRVEGISLTLVAGLNEGEFPLAVTDHGLLSDMDKQQLEPLGIRLEDRNQRNASRELMYVWRAMTKPSHALVASMVTASPDGSAKAPGIAYTRLLYLFPYLKEQVIRFDLSMIRPQAAPAPVVVQTCAPPSPDPEGGTTEYAPVPPGPHDLSPETARALLGDTLYLTQSRIQTFVQCPFRFYCTYLLDLRERKTAAIDYSDSGTFFHFLLEKVLRACISPEGQFTPPPESAIESLADTFVNEYLRELLAATDSDASRSARILHLFSRLRSLALVLLRDVLGEFSHSRFLPLAFELRIGGRAAGSPPAYEIELTDGCRILLGGVVDRVDVYRQDDAIYVRVVDYKSGSKTFSLSDVQRGINLQLLLYLFALCRTQNSRESVHPAGVMYLTLAEDHGKITPQRSGLLCGDSELLLAMNDEANPHYLAGARQNSDGDFRGSALIAAEQFDSLERDIRATLRAIGNDMRAGRASKTADRENCRFCPLRDHCASADTDI